MNPATNFEDRSAVPFHDFKEQNCILKDTPSRRRRRRRRRLTPADAWGRARRLRGWHTGGLRPRSGGGASGPVRGPGVLGGRVGACITAEDLGLQVWFGDADRCSHCTACLFCVPGVCVKGGEWRPDKEHVIPAALVLAAANTSVGMGDRCGLGGGGRRGGRAGAGGHGWVRAGAQRGSRCFTHSRRRRRRQPNAAAATAAVAVAARSPASASAAVRISPARPLARSLVLQLAPFLASRIVSPHSHPAPVPSIPPLQPKITSTGWDIVLRPHTKCAFH